MKVNLYLNGPSAEWAGDELLGKFRANILKMMDSKNAATLVMGGLLILPWHDKTMGTDDFLYSYVQPMSSEQRATNEPSKLWIYPGSGWFGRCRHLPFDSPGRHVDLSLDDFSDEARCFYLLRRHQRMWDAVLFLRLNLPRRNVPASRNQ